MRALSFVFRVGGLPFIGLLAVQIVQGLIPAFVIWLTARAVEGSFSALVGLVAVFGGLLFARDIVDTLVILLLTEARDRVVFRARRELLASTLSWQTVVPFEDPDIVNARLAAKMGVERSARAVMVISNFAGAVFAIVPLIGIDISVSLLLPFLVIIGLIPLTVHSIRLEDRVWSAESDHADEMLSIDNLETVGEQPHYAREIRALNAGPWILKNWSGRRGSIVASIRRLRLRGGLAALGFTLISVVTSLIGFAIAVDGGAAQATALVVTIGVVIQMREQMYAIVSNIADLRAVLAPFSALVKYVALSPDGEERRSARGDPGDNNMLKLSNCGFTYPSKNVAVLSAIDIKVSKGETVAIVGPNGGGKSTFINMISGLYPDAAVTGQVEIASQPVIMFQDFSRYPFNLRENIEVGTPFDEAEIWDALRIVELDDYVRGLDEGLNTRLYLDVEKGGINLSGGQWQRLSLARAIAHARNSEFLILDEVTSSLDPDSEHRILSRLHSEVFPGMTVINVTHRMDQAARADRLVLMQSGSIAAVGAPRELYESSAWYRSAFDSQGSGFGVFEPRAEQRTEAEDDVD